jgi:antirestriction protein ArdC
MISPKVSETLNKIVELFKGGDVPKAISIATFPPFDVPSNAWSLTNRIIMAINGTSDARGYKQWSECNRYVKKGSKAFHILAPWLAKKTRKGDCAPREYEDDYVEKTGHISHVLRGFLAVPVFKLEDTEGEPLDYQKLELPELPLLEVAESWGINVAPVAYQGGWYGYYRPDKDEIRLATPSEKTFLHELSHAAHKKVLGELRPGQDWKQEVVAELSAQTLCHVFGCTENNTTGNSYEYISFYAEKAKKDVGVACMSVLGDVEKVLNLIVAECAVIEANTLSGISVPQCLG